VIVEVIVEVKNVAISQYPIPIRDMTTYLSVTAEEEKEQYPGLRMREKRFGNAWLLVRKPFGAGGTGLPKHLKPGEFLYLNWTFSYGSVLPRIYIQIMILEYNTDNQLTHPPKRNGGLHSRKILMENTKKLIRLCCVKERFHVMTIHQLPLLS